MESLSYAFDGRGLLFSDDIELQLDSLATSRNMLSRYDAKPLSELDKDFSVSRSEADDSLGYRGSTSQYMTLLEGTGYKTNDASCQFLSPTSTITLNSSPSPMNSNVEKLTNQKETNGSFEEDPVLSLPEPLLPAKRARVMNLQSQVHVCQVHGCNKDLSSAKDYYKRHKVCDVHSKTPLVVVDGIEQRFCQQCSRFHRLMEFDEGKRSCRKRLAGHNERRRKPQLGTHFGSAIFDADLTTSLLVSRILHGGLFDQHSIDPNSQLAYVKLEDEPSPVSLSTLPIKFGQLRPVRSLPQLHGMGKQHQSRDCLNAPTSVQESVCSNPSRALSLLSAQSANSLGDLPGIKMAVPPTFKDNHRYDSSPVDTGTSSNVYPSGFLSSARIDKEECFLLSDISEADLKVQRNKNMHEETIKNPTHLLSAGAGNTVDLLQLSFHLQRIDRERNSLLLKHEKDIFCRSKTA